MKVRLNRRTYALAKQIAAEQPMPVKFWLAQCVTARVLRWKSALTGEKFDADVVKAAGRFCETCNPPRDATECTNPKRHRAGWIK